ncbi:IS1182 family transposase [Methylobacterium durans]|uniref:IS1182 family transposase n=1 Tax=Methylobacterium durans TaxID=2202825 RepID=A0A2U8WA59_9HYPH|nr:IS1182 family transposase [Methylobacterium durans]AWN42330.1 IS1182 family transposase [Methylobacterium durans]AWN43794.1 IS1182 family transposase [Methylobacterium durans]
MSLRLQSPLPPVPEDTARVAQIAFRRGNPYLLLRTRLGTIFADTEFADLYPARGQPAYAPWRLALVTLLQFREGLSDRQAAEAVRARIDWKYLLALDLTDPGFDYSVLCEFRGRLLQHDATGRLLARILDAARDQGVLKGRGRQRTDSTHVLAAVRDLNRIELLAETLRAALNAVAALVPDWLRRVVPSDWHERYDRRIEDARLPTTGLKREVYVLQVGADGCRLLDALDGADAPPLAVALPSVAVLRRVWARHFARAGDGSPLAGAGIRLRPVQGRGPGDRIESPYDVDARFRAKSGTDWTGYMVHLTETCDPDLPRLVVHTDTTPANVHEAMRTAAIHAALASSGLLPCEHLVDAAYVSAEHLVTARERHGIALIGPTRPNQSWQMREEDAFQVTDFAVDWERHRVRCPEGHESTSWGAYRDKASGRPFIRAGFKPAVCRLCPAKPRCTRAASRRLSLHPRAEHEALAAARQRQESEEGRRLYGQRQGIEATIAQGVRSFGLRRARYRGLAKTTLQSVATAAALNVDRLAAWLSLRPLAPTRTSRFKALTA